MVAPVIAAAGLTAAAGLFSSLMQQQQAREAQERAEKLAKEQAEQEALQRAQQNQLSTIQGMGHGEQNALQTLIATLSKTAR